MSQIYLYKNGQRSPLLYPVDAAGWEQLGWKKTMEESFMEESIAKSQLKHEPISQEINLGFDDDFIDEYTLESLTQILEHPDLGWREIRVIARRFGITEKPSEGWDAAIPLILEAQNQNA